MVTKEGLLKGHSRGPKPHGSMQRTLARLARALNQIECVLLKLEPEFEGDSWYSGIEEERDKWLDKIAGASREILRALARDVDELPPTLNRDELARACRLLRTCKDLDRPRLLALVNREDVRQVVDHAALVLTDPRRRIVEQTGQHRGPGSAPVFDTPEGSAWGDLELRFTDGDTVSINVHGKRARLNYAEMGMSDRRNGRPTKQWELLREFAEGRGFLDWNSPGADPKNQKRREQLSRDLRRFFCIDGDPIRLLEDGKGWQTHFRVYPRE